MKSKPKDMTLAEFDADLMKQFNLPMKDLMKEIQKNLQKIYPNSCFSYFGTEDASPKKKTLYGLCGGYGDESDIRDLLTSLMDSDKQWNGWLSEAYLRWVMYMDLETVKNKKEFLAMREAHLQFAEAGGLDVSKWRELQKKPAESIHQMGQDVKPAELEAHISEVEKELKRLKDKRNPSNTIALLKAEIKRLNRAGDIAKAKEKEDAIREIQEGVEKQAKRRAFLLGQVEKMHAAKQAKKLQREQAERDRQKSQQFNPHAAAKAKRQKIRERQAERKASKKKASENKQWVNTPIGQVVARM